MSGQLDPDTFNGAHPSTAQFVELLVAWGFRRRKDTGTHVVFRGPNGGVLRMPRQTSGRANPVQVSKAARLAGVSVTQLLAGPLASAEPVTAPAPIHASAATPTPTTPPAKRKGARRPRNGRDSLTCRVLAVHSTAGRPLSFEEVAAACGDDVTRTQVVQVSSKLCRDGHLEKVRTGYYQWPTDQPQAEERPAPVAPPPVAITTLRPAAPARDRRREARKARLAERMFPDGLPAMSAAEFAELDAHLEHWVDLADRLTGHAEAS